MFYRKKTEEWNGKETRLEPQIIILHPHDEERALLRAAIEETVDWECIELSDEPAVVQWLEHNSQPVGAVFIGGDKARFYRLIRLFRWHEESRSALIYRLEDSSEQGWAASLSDLGEIVDRILVKPVLPHLIRERLDYLWKRKGAQRGGNALVFDDAPTASSFEKRQLAETLGTLYTGVREANEIQEALTYLEEKRNETKLVVCHWEMPSRRGAELLRRVNAMLEAKSAAGGTVSRDGNPRRHVEDVPRSDARASTSGFRG